MKDNLLIVWFCGIIEKFAISLKHRTVRGYGIQAELTDHLPHSLRSWAFLSPLSTHFLPFLAQGFWVLTQRSV